MKYTAKITFIFHTKRNNVYFLDNIKYFFLSFFVIKLYT